MDGINGDDKLQSNTKTLINHVFNVPSIPTEIGNQRLLICLNSTLKKIDLVQIIPYLCAKVVSGDDPRLERILGSDCMQTILKLFVTEMAWIESNKKILHKKDQMFSQQQPQLHGDIKNRLTLSSESESDTTSSECNDSQPEPDAFSRHVGIMLTSESSSSKIHDANDAGDVTSFKVPMQEHGGQLLLLQTTENEHRVETVVKDIKNLYRRLVKELEKNTRFLLWMEENANEIEVPQNHEHKQISEQFINFQVSSGFNHFQSCMGRLYDLMRNRLLNSFEQTHCTAKLMKESWIHEIVYNRDVARLRDKLQSMKVKWENKRVAYDDEIAHLQSACDQMILAGFQRARCIVKDLEMENLVNHKIEEIKGDQRQSTILTLEQGQVNLYLQQEEESSTMKHNRKVLEDRLSAIIAEYDSQMMERQYQLDELDEEERRNNAMIKSLNQMVEDTQEQFEEMRNTKKLKEILRNIAMADNFRENRAARIIQMAWRRYKHRKLRKQRRKGRFKKRPNPEEIWRQLGFMTYCTPQDHVRALQKKKDTPVVEKLKRKKKKPFKVHTGSSFRSRQSSSISLFLL